MFFGISVLAAFIGFGLAAAAAFLPDTGVTGSIGAMLVLVGTIAVGLTLGWIAYIFRSRGLRGTLITIMVLAASLTAVAAWFLMQNDIVAAMIVVVLAFLLSGRPTRRKVAR